jgi:uncharacterized membrane protein
MTTSTSEPNVHGSPDRMIAFSDGVVAIAITLLILPLAEIEPAEDQDFLALLAEQWPALFAFALSFAVIANYWFTHHTVFALVRHQNARLLRLNTVWLACIVFIPFPTALLNDARNGYATFYIATLTAASVLTLLLTRYLGRHPELTHPGSGPELREHLVAGWVVVLTLLIALFVSLASQTLGLWAILLLIPAQMIAGRRARRQKARE